MADSTTKILTAPGVDASGTPVEAMATTPAPVVATSGSDPYWYKDAVIYQLHVKAFFDSNDDGIGDLRGLTEKLDYVKDLGVNTIWLLPFYPSPLRDDGYDVADYHNVHPNYGTRADFREFVHEAHDRGLRVITELIVNHTSDQHPWFQAARRARTGSSKRNYYVWSDDPNRYARHEDHLHRYREVELDMGRGCQGLLLAPVLQPPAGLELRQSDRS